MSIQFELNAYNEVFDFHWTNSVIVSSSVISLVNSDTGNSILSSDLTFLLESKMKTKIK